jgi:two-component system NarL family sensor kinase
MAFSAALSRLLSRLRPRLRYGQKLFLIATLPLVLVATLIAILVAEQARQTSEREIAALEVALIDAKRLELRNYLSMARSAFGIIYGNAAPDDAKAKLEVAQIMAAMVYGRDGFFFIYDYDGKNIVSPRQTWLIERNWKGLTDSRGTPVVDRLIELARQGAGYHTYYWPKPSTGEEALMVSYVQGLQDWRWAVGTGIFIDDVQEVVAGARAQVEARVRKTFAWIGGITLCALLIVFASGMALNIRERRLADAKLKALTERVLEGQETERGRVARELHDSISQILVGIRYTLELARRRVDQGDPRGQESLNQSISHLNNAIQEVRRISRDLRPGILDDLGLGPALQGLTEDFSRRTGIKVRFQTNPFRNRLDNDAKIALYRIAQEALTNIDRHSGATEIEVLVRGTRNGALLRIADNGRGFDRSRRSDDGSGLGLRNMAERVEQLDGSLRIVSSKAGTVIEATVPLSHMLSPAGEGKDQTRRAK